MGNLATCPACPPPVECPPPVQCPPCPQQPLAPVQQPQPQFDETAFINNLANEVVSGTNAQFMGVVRTYVSPAVLQAAQTYIQRNRGDAIAVAKSQGNFAQDVAANVGPGIQQWLRALARKQDPTIAFNPRFGALIGSRKTTQMGILIVLLLIVAGIGATMWLKRQK